MAQGDNNFDFPAALDATYRKASSLLLGKHPHRINQKSPLNNP